MQGAQFIIIDTSNLKDLAEALAPLIKTELHKVEDDPYMTPAQLSEKIPVMSEFKIKDQIRKEKYGKKIGPKGKLTAKVSEVKSFNKI